MLSLDFSLYTGTTMLRDWWKQVKTHMSEIQTAHNTLENQLTAETMEREALMSDLEDKVEDLISDSRAAGSSLASERQAREAADDAIKSSITAEASSREAADQTLQGNIDSEAWTRETTDNALLQAVNREASARAVLESELTEKINTEATERKQDSSNLDTAVKTLQASVTTLESKSHSHTNLSVLAGIKASDIAAWNAKSAGGTGGTGGAADAGLTSYLLGICAGLLHDVESLYGAHGVTVYDGGIYGETQIKPDLNGSGFNETGSYTVVDCGTFDSSIFTA